MNRPPEPALTPKCKPDLAPTAKSRPTNAGGSDAPELAPTAKSMPTNAGGSNAGLASAGILKTYSHMSFDVLVRQEAASSSQHAEMVEFVQQIATKLGAKQTHQNETS